MMILRVAFSHSTEVSCLNLNKCFTGSDHSEIILESGLRVSKLSSLKRLEIKEKKGKIFTAEEILRAIRYGMECHNLTKISFIDCVLPLSFDSKSLIPTMKTQTLTVTWKPLDCEFHLDLSSGKWIDFLPASFDDQLSLQQMCSKPIVLQSKEVNQHQPSLMMILKIASSHNIEVSCLNLEKCFTGADQSEIILESGLRVPKLSALKRLEIKEEEGKIFTAEEILGAIRYGIECQNLTKISFIDCVLPLSFDSKSLLPAMKTQTLTVSWKPLDFEFHLDLRSGKWIDFLPASFDDQMSLQQICSKPIVPQSKEVNQHQPSLMMILRVAFSHSIEVSCLKLDKCFTGSDHSEIILESGLRVSKLSSLKRLEIKEKKGKIFTAEEILRAIRYGMECHNLTKISFIDCVLPLSFDSKSLIPTMKTQTLTVTWKPLDCEFHLDLSSGKWIDFLPASFDDRQSLQQMCSKPIVLQSEEVNQHQQSLIMILKIASSHNIAISCLKLNKCFSGADQSEITLESGLRVLNLSSLEQLVIKEQKGKIFTAEEILGAIRYGIECHNLTKISFIDCVLPLSFDSKSLIYEMKTQKLTISWKLLDFEFHLDFSSGKRLEFLLASYNDRLSLQQMCSKPIVLQSKDVNQHRPSLITILKIASSHNIAVSCLNLDKCFTGADRTEITLESGICVPNLSSLEQLEIKEKKGKIFTPEEILGAIRYGNECHNLTKISFIDCVLPLAFDSKSLIPEMKTQKLTISWKRLDFEFHLDFSSGKWKEFLPASFDDQLSLQQMCSKPVVLQSKEVNQHQPSLIMILKTASSHNIAVSCVNIDKCFTGADQTEITLESGIRVPNLSSLERLEIKEKKGKIFTPEEILGAIRYGIECHNLTKISFIDCVLPLSFNSKALIPAMRTQQLTVSWKPLDYEFHLDLSSGKWRDFSPDSTKGQHSLQRLCSRTVSLRETDSKQLQKSTILLLEIASNHNIPISKLRLQWAFNGFDGKDIRLESGLSLSSLSSVEKISINEKAQNQEFTEEEVIGLINYGIQSPRFKELWLDNCKLPSSINPDIIQEESRSRSIKVISSNEARYLDLISGQWRKPDDIQTITEMCSGAMAIGRDTSESVQRSVIEFLVEASIHDIPIFQVDLVWSFSKIDKDGNIILSSGLSLPIITSIERMEIQTEKGREMNKHEVNGILNYVQHSQRLNKLELTDCLLPSSIPVGPTLSTLESQGVNVVWTPDSDKDDERYWLDLDSGRWEKKGTW